ncbi:MAG: hypothetical protein JXM73_04650 [Anaerolineae bacterium]|nr:hypothetical protein [Anaerolineae bacterium]
MSDQAVLPVVTKAMALLDLLAAQVADVDGMPDLELEAAAAALSTECDRLLGVAGRQFWNARMATAAGRFTKGRCLAWFVPQAWVGDYAVEVDGRCQFDITAAVLQMGREKALTLRDDDYDSDSLAETAGLTDLHSGPFRVECEEAIRNFFAALEEA